MSETATRRAALEIAWAHMPGAALSDVLDAAKKIEEFLEPAPPPPPPPPRLLSRTSRDAFAAELFAAGKNNKQVAAALGVTPGKIPLIKRRLGLPVQPRSLTPEQRAACAARMRVNRGARKAAR